MRNSQSKYSFPVAIVTMAFSILNAMAANDPVSASSSEVRLNTITFTSAKDVMVREADTRTYAVDWSGASKLNTKKIISSVFLIR